MLCKDQYKENKLAYNFLNILQLIASLAPKKLKVN